MRNESKKNSQQRVQVPGERTLMLLALGSLSLGSGCIGPEADEGAPNLQSTQQSAVVCTLPTSCQDVKACAPSAPDGEYGLYVNADANKPWVAYCKDMAGTPKEYLQLRFTGGSSNFAQYTAGGASSGTNAKSNYTKVRINPSTLVVDTSDQTFTTSTGSVMHGSINVTSMPFGVAMSCDAQPSGLANVDLRGTAFALPANAFTLWGASPQGVTTYSSNNQVANLTGGGFCGYNQPAPGVFNPFNTNGGPLSLVYLKPAQ